MLFTEPILIFMSIYLSLIYMLLYLFFFVSQIYRPRLLKLSEFSLRTRLSRPTPSSSKDSMVSTLAILVYASCQSSSAS